MIFVCTKCGESKIESIAAIGHDWENETCLICGEMKGTDGVIYGERLIKN